ncbi:glycosyltransferase family 39 protein [Arthrobacter sp. MDB2-24]
MSVPSFWVDEAATVSAIDRSFPDLLRMLGNIDAVHGFYYILMYGWSSTFGMSELSLRFPSLLAIALSAGLITAIGRRIGTPIYGLSAALLFVLLPRTQYIGTDARSYALAVAASVAATYFLVRLRDAPERRFWVGYVLGGLLATLLSFYTVLVFVAHVVTACLDARLRARWLGLLKSSAAWLVPTAFLAVLGSRQQFQIAWLRPIDGGVLSEIALLQFFSDAYYMLDGKVAPQPTTLENFTMVGLAVLSWSVVLVVAIRLRAYFIVKLALPLLAVPLAAVIGGSLVLGSPYYLPRYVSFILPAVPFLAAGISLDTWKLRHEMQRWIPMSYVAAAALLVLPSYLGQRTEFGRSPNDDFRFVAETIGENARAGEALALTVDSGLGYIAYRDSFDGLVDVTLGTDAGEWGRIYDQRFDMETSKNRILANDVVWLVHARKDPTTEEVLESFGYTEAQRFDGTGSSVVEFVRGRAVTK